MSSKHQKKRNSILLYEFLVRTISNSLIENDKRRSAAALKVLRRHFKPGTNIYKEFRIMNALAKTTVASEHTAASILKEARAAVEGIDPVALDREKSILIRNINHVINDDNFYDQHVPEYRNYATTQVLFNEWRSSDKNLMVIGQFEDQLLRWLMSDKTEPVSSTLSENTPGTARLLMKVMTKKLNEKYSGVLNEQQKSLVKTYALSSALSDATAITMKLNEIKSTLLGKIDSYAAELRDDDYVKGKLSEAKGALLTEDLTNIDDDTVTRFMLYSRLNDELDSKE